MPEFKVPIRDLILDFNNFGDSGLQQLTKGLYLNETIQKLSLNYCGITLAGVQYLQEILAFFNSDLRCLYMEGNFIRNEGIY